MKGKLILLFSLLLFSCAAKQEKENTTQWQYFYDIGMSSYIAKNYSEAVANFFKASEIAPTEPKVWNALGMAYMEVQEWEKAEKAFLRALQVDKRYTEARLNLGVLYYRQGAYEKALEPIKEAIEDEAFPQKHMALYYLAKTYQALGNSDEYKKHLLRAVAYNPMFIDAQLELANVYELEGDYASAKKVYQNLINNGINDLSIELNLARVEYKLGNYASAKNHIKNILEAKQRNPQFVSQAYDLLSLVLIAEQSGRQPVKEDKEIQSETPEESKVSSTGMTIDQKQVDIKEPKDQESIISKSYKIQLGAFSSLESAKAWKSRLENNLNLREVVIVERSGIYRVLYGDFNNLKEATKELTKLKSMNIYGFIVRE